MSEGSIVARGHCFFSGIGGLEQDYKEAVECYRIAAAKGDSWAQHSLGFCYEKGLGVFKQPQEAVKYYSNSSEQDDPSGQAALGCCYQYGIGVKRDLKKAFELYNKSVKQGGLCNRVTQVRLGFCYLKGLGTEK
eukprot:CAMPEP_0185281282 /NCGR_PEP_ID=MMETSP1359-20130426/66632_1 /TAXON_ID=552665 /ORGANISM="Bigelowiella longifila, Strain CCMP242" /LENGTH=133 /DNA_ID=CAMNT_0027876701 /DNA_START=530 /DNA_END=928 /DNA_ORIENTATION=+